MLNTFAEPNWSDIHMQLSGTCGQIGTRKGLVSLYAHLYGILCAPFPLFVVIPNNWFRVTAIGVKFVGPSGASATLFIIVIGTAFFFAKEVQKGPRGFLETLPERLNFSLQCFVA